MAKITCPECANRVSVDPHIKKCPICGHAFTNVPTKSSTPKSGWTTASRISAICGCVTFILGISKLIINTTYVYGDAYNYIINSNMAVAYFVLTATFVISALLMVCIDSIKNRDGR